MNNNTEDPKNIPDYLNIRDSKWKNLSESNRQTLIKTITDDVVATVYLKYKDIFDAYTQVKKQFREIQKAMGIKKPSGIVPCMHDLHNSIDPMNRSIYSTLNNYVEELKEERREPLQRLLQVSVNADSKREITEAILDELEQLEQ